MYKKWNPIEGNLKRLSCEALHDDFEGFRIILRSEDDSLPLLRVYFENALAYRNIDEGDRLKTINQNREFDGHSFFIVENSNWLEWFDKESLSIHKKENIKHYAIYTINDCIDILSESAPDIEWID
jgi:hypothetical protein